MRDSRFRRHGTVAGSVFLAVILVLLFMVQLPQTAMADVSQVGIDIEIDNGVSGDVSIAGIDVEVRGASAEEFSAVGVDVLFEGDVSGDASVAAVDAVIDGTVGGDLSVAGAEVNVTAEVGGEVSMAGAEVHFTGSADHGEIAGAEVHIDGTFRGDLHVAAEELHISPSTSIAGDFRFTGPEEPTLPDGLTIGGTYTYEYGDFDEWVDGDVPIELFPVIAIAGVTGAFFVFMMLAVSVLLAGGLLLLLMTGLTGRTIDGIREQPMSSLGMGIVVLVGLLVLIPILCVTVIGIPLAFAIIAFYPLLLLVGFTIAVLGVPYLILRSDPRETGGFAKIGIFFLSLVALMVLFAIPVIGQVLFLAILLMGVGAFGAAVLGGRNNSGAAAAA